MARWRERSMPVCEACSKEILRSPSQDFLVISLLPRRGRWVPARPHVVSGTYNAPRHRPGLQFERQVGSRTGRSGQAGPARPLPWPEPDFLLFFFFKKIVIVKPSVPHSHLNTHSLTAQATLSLYLVCVRVEMMVLLYILARGYVKFWY